MFTTWVLENINRDAEELQELYALALLTGGEPQEDPVANTMKGTLYVISGRGLRACPSTIMSKPFYLA